MPSCAQVLTDLLVYDTLLVVYRRWSDVVATLDRFVDEVDQLSRRLMRNIECCDRMLVGTVSLTAAQAYTLLALYERGDVTMNELATEMRLHGTTMTRHGRCPGGEAIRSEERR